MDVLLLGSGILLSGYWINQQSKNPRSFEQRQTMSPNETPSGDHIYKSNQTQKVQQNLQQTLDNRVTQSKIPGSGIIDPQNLTKVRDNLDPRIQVNQEAGVKPLFKQYDQSVTSDAVFVVDAKTGTGTVTIPGTLTTTGTGDSGKGIVFSPQQTDPSYTGVVTPQTGLPFENFTIQGVNGSGSGSSLKSTPVQGAVGQKQVLQPNKNPDYSGVVSALTGLPFENFSTNQSPQYSLQDVGKKGLNPDSFILTQQDVTVGPDGRQYGRDLKPLHKQAIPSLSIGVTKPLASIDLNVGTTFQPSMQQNGGVNPFQEPRQKPSFVSGPAQFGDKIDILSQRLPIVKQREDLAIKDRPILINTIQAGSLPVARADPGVIQEPKRPSYHDTQINGQVSGVQSGQKIYAGHSQPFKSKVSVENYMGQVQMKTKKASQFKEGINKQLNPEKRFSFQLRPQVQVKHTKPVDASLRETFKPSPTIRDQQGRNNFMTPPSQTQKGQKSREQFSNFRNDKQQLDDQNYLGSDIKPVKQEIGEYSRQTKMNFNLKTERRPTEYYHAPGPQEAKVYNNVTTIGKTRMTRKNVEAHNYLPGPKLETSREFELSQNMRTRKYIDQSQFEQRLEQEAIDVSKQLEDTGLYSVIRRTKQRRK